jgi:nucleoside-diphosphate-sugar epimerase
MQDKPYKTVLIVGCGYMGRRVARLLPAGQYHVCGCVRSPESAGLLKESGVSAIEVDLDQAEQPADWATGYEAVFYFAPPPAAGRQDTRMRNFLRVLDKKDVPRRIVYISTSAVYGDCGGAWITEMQVVKPGTDRGHRRLDAERQLIAWCQAQKTQWTVLRVPGIYGPGKLPLARLRKGTPVLREEDAPCTNRIHADDLATICIAAMNSVKCNTVYNVSDGHPGNMTDYFFRVADAAGLSRPATVTRAQAEQELSAGMLSFLNDSRRMRNDKMLEELGIKLQYPGLTAGLAACFKD